MGRVHTGADVHIYVTYPEKAAGEGAETFVNSHVEAAFKRKSY